MSPQSADAAPEAALSVTKRPLPSRSGVADQATGPAAEKPGSEQEPESSVPPSQKVNPPAAGLKKPLPVRVAAPELKSSAAVSEKTVSAAPENAPIAAVTGDKRPLPLRSVAPEPVASGAISATAPGEKHALPARTLPSEVITDGNGKADSKKPLASVQHPAVDAEKTISGSSAVEKRSLPQRIDAQSQNVPVAAQPDSVLASGPEAGLPATGSAKSAVSLPEIKRPLPQRSASLDQKSPAVVKLEGHSPPPSPVETVSSGGQAVVKRPLPVHIALNEQKSVPEEKKPLPAPASSPVVKMTALPRIEAPKPPGATAKPAKEKSVSKPELKRPVAAGAAAASGGSWTVLIGSYVLETALAADKAKLTKAGFTSHVQAGAKQTAAMSRLLLAEYDDREIARAALDKLKRHTADAFMIDQGGKHAVYAGSYLLDGRAASEKERLGTAGFALQLKKVDVSIPSKSLTVGSFRDKGAAETALNKLKAAGISATLVRQ